jgi:hypothetical protein
MKRLMGFVGFKSTKNTKVPGNDKLYGVRKDKKTEYRQYMNRVGGFNRPLSPTRLWALFKTRTEKRIEVSAMAFLGGDEDIFGLREGDKGTDSATGLQFLTDVKAVQRRSKDISTRQSYGSSIQNNQSRFGLLATRSRPVFDHHNRCSTLLEIWAQSRTCHWERKETNENATPERIQKKKPHISQRPPPAALTILLFSLNVGSCNTGLTNE